MDIESDINTRVTALPQPRLEKAGVDCLVVIHSSAHSQLGKRYLLESAALTIGRGRDNDIVLLNDSVSRQHARIERRGQSVYGVDVGSTNGTYVNDNPKPIKVYKMTPGDRIKIGDTVIKYLSGSDVEAQYHEIIFSMTITDGLTNLFNRKQLDTALNEEVLRAQRHERALSVLMLDIDHFKSINDTHGHSAGDTVLRELAVLLQKRMRPNDKLGRYGGEEFCAILPDTPLQNALTLAEQLRDLVNRHTFKAEERDICATISIGVGAWQAGMQATDLYRLADRRLYEAKRTGRNKVCA